MDKAPCTKLYGVLIRFLKVIKLSFEFNVSDVIPANVQNISPPFLFFVMFLYIFYELMKLMKFRMSKLYLDVCDVICANEHANMIIVTFSKLFGFSLMPFCFMMKKDCFK